MILCRAVARHPMLTTVYAGEMGPIQLPGHLTTYLNLCRADGTLLSSSHGELLDEHSRTRTFRL
jgi:hypothetical protein